MPASPKALMVVCNLGPWLLVLALLSVVCGEVQLESEGECKPLAVISL